LFPAPLPSIKEKILIRTEESMALEGQEEHQRIVFIEFPATVNARRFTIFSNEQSKPTLLFTFSCGRCEEFSPTRSIKTYIPTTRSKEKSDI
jgi:hypothetical protein